MCIEITDIADGLTIAAPGIFGPESVSREFDLRTVRCALRLKFLVQEKQGAFGA